MLSRVASLVYWMARYLERAENTARIVDVNAQLVLDLMSRRASDDPKAWVHLVYVSGGDELFFKLHGTDRADERTVLEFMLFERRNPSSVVSCINAARENARCIRDQLPSDVWEALNTFYLRLREDDFTRYAQLGSTEYLGRLKSSLQLLYGTAASMMPRDESWWFFDLGRHLERADNTSRIIDVKYFTLLPDREAVGSALDVIQWASVLRCCSAYEAFRRHRRGQLNLERVVDYLVRDPDFPRSIRYSVRTAAFALAQIAAHHPRSTITCPASGLLDAMGARLEHGAVRDILLGGLHEYLDGIQLEVAHVHNAIVATYIDYASATAPHVA